MKGFALMLLIGTLISLLTAVAATRAILGLLAGFSWFDNPKLMGAEGEPPKWIRRDFVGLRSGGSGSPPSWSRSRCSRSGSRA